MQLNRPFRKPELQGHLGLYLVNQASVYLHVITKDAQLTRYGSKCPPSAPAARVFENLMACCIVSVVLLQGTLYLVS